MYNQRTLTVVGVGGKDRCMAGPSLTRLDLTKEENLFLFVCPEAVESKLKDLNN